MIEAIETPTDIFLRTYRSTDFYSGKTLYEDGNVIHLLPSNLETAGTKLSIKDLASELEVENFENFERGILLDGGVHIEKYDQATGTRFSLKVNHGICEEKPIAIMKVANNIGGLYAEGFESAINRLDYMEPLSEICDELSESILSDEDGSAISIYEDCVASIATVYSFVKECANRELLGENAPFNTLKIRAAVMSAQSILLAKALGKAFRINIDLEAGIVPTGLTAADQNGNGGNYLYNPKENIGRAYVLSDDPESIREILDEDRDLAVVSDMGNWVKSLPNTPEYNGRLPINRLRVHDHHGDASGGNLLPRPVNTHSYTDWVESISDIRDMKTIHIFPRGGYFTAAHLLNSIITNDYDPKSFNFVELRASRLHKDGRFGTVLYLDEAS